MKGHNYNYESSPLSPSNKILTDLTSKTSPTNTPFKKKLFDVTTTATSSNINGNSNNNSNNLNSSLIINQLSKTPFKSTSSSSSSNNLNNTVTGSAIKQHLSSKPLPQFSSIDNNMSLIQQFLPEDKIPMSVYLRIRPLSNEEVKLKETNCFTLLNPTTVSIKSIRSDSDSNKFSFSSVLPPNTTQAQLFKTITYPLLNSFLNGHNVLLLAYGVTNAGKTYTITGNKKSPGVIPRSLELIFNSIPNHLLKKNKENIKLKDEEIVEQPTLQPSNNNSNSNNNNNNNNDEPSDDENSTSTNTTSDIGNLLKQQQIQQQLDDILPIQISEDYNYSVWMSYYEIHKKNINDLLISPNDKNRPQLKIETDDKTVNIRNIQEVLISSAKDALDNIALGEANRKFGNTKLNSKSSRSHAVLTLKLFASPRNIPKSEITFNQIRCSKLCIIDLAGSERASRTETTGERLKEASGINTSLFILGKCIEGLKQQSIQQQQQLLNSANKLKRQSVYTSQNSIGGNNNNVIPWRESDLTKICQEYFVGNGKAAMIVNVSPSNRDSEETLNVLRFSANAKEITTQSKIKMLSAPPPPTPLPLSKKRKSIEQHSSTTNNVSNNTTTTSTQLQQSINEIRKKIHLESMYQLNNNNNGNQLKNNNLNKNVHLDYIAMEKDQLLDQIQVFQRKISDFEIKMAENEVHLRQSFSEEMAQSIIDIESQYNERLKKETQSLYVCLQNKLNLIKCVNSNEKEKLLKLNKKLESELYQTKNKLLLSQSRVQPQPQQQPQQIEEKEKLNTRTDDEWLLEISELQNQNDNIQSKLNSIIVELDDQKQTNGKISEELSIVKLRNQEIQKEKQELLNELEQIKIKSDDLIKQRQLETMKFKESMEAENQLYREKLEADNQILIEKMDKRHNLEKNSLQLQLNQEKKERQNLLDELNKLKAKESENLLLLNQSIENQKNHAQRLLGHHHHHQTSSSMSPFKALKIGSNSNLFATPLKSKLVGKIALVNNETTGNLNSPHKTLYTGDIEKSLSGKGVSIRFTNTEIIPGSPIQLAPGTPNSISSQTPDRPILDPNQYGDNGLLMKEIDDNDYLNITSGTLNLNDNDINEKDIDGDTTMNNNDDDQWLDINIGDDNEDQLSQNKKQNRKSKSISTIKRIRDKTVAAAMILSSNSNSNDNNDEDNKKVVRKSSSISNRISTNLSSRKSSKESLLNTSKQHIVSINSTPGQLSPTHDDNNNNISIISLNDSNISQSSPIEVGPKEGPSSPAQVHISTSTRAPPPIDKSIASSSSTATTTTKSKKSALSILNTPKKIANMITKSKSSDKSEKEKEKEKEKSSKSTPSIIATTRSKRAAATSAISSLNNNNDSIIEVDSSPSPPPPPKPTLTRSTRSSRATIAKIQPSSTSTTSTTTSTRRKILPTISIQDLDNSSSSDNNDNDDNDSFEEQQKRVSTKKSTTTALKSKEKKETTPVLIKTRGLRRRSQIPTRYPTK